MKLPVGGLGRAASPPAGSGAEPREPNAFQQKYNENGFKLLTIGGEQACCRTVALLYTPKSDCVVSAVKKKLRPARLLVRRKPDQPDRLLRPCSMADQAYNRCYGDSFRQFGRNSVRPRIDFGPCAARVGGATYLEELEGGEQLSGLLRALVHVEPLQQGALAVDGAGGHQGAGCGAAEELGRALQGDAHTLSCHILLLSHPTSVTSYFCHILLLSHPTSVTSYFCHILLLSHPTSVTSYFCHILLLSHPTSITSYFCHILLLYSSTSSIIIVYTYESTSVKFFFFFFLLHSLLYLYLFLLRLHTSCIMYSTCIQN